MTRKKVSIDPGVITELMENQEDFPKPLIQTVVQEILELEMTSTSGEVQSVFAVDLAGKRIVPV